MTPPGVKYGRGFAWNMVFAFISKATIALVSILVANRLGPGPVGIYATLTTIYNFAELMREAGLKQAFYNDTISSPERYRTYCRLSVQSGLSFGLVMLVLAYPAALFYAVPDLQWCMGLAAFAVAVNSLSAIPSASLLKDGRFRDTGFIEGIATLASGLVTLALVWLGFGLFGLMMQLVARSVVLLALFQRLRPLEVRHYDRGAVRPIMRVCLQLVATDLLWFFYSIADMLLVPKVLGIVANGNYSWGKRLITLPAELIFAPLHRTIIVAVGHRADDPNEIGRAFIRTLGLAMLLLVPLYTGIAFFARPLVHALLRPDFWPTAEVLPILCISEGARAIGTFAATALVAARRANIPLFAWIAPYPIAAGLLATRWGHLDLPFVASSFATGMILVNVIVLTGAFTVLTGWKGELGKLARAAAGTTITVLAAYGLSRAPLQSWPLLIVAIALVPLFHLSVIGMLFAGRPLAYMSPSGIRRLRGTL